MRRAAPLFVAVLCLAGCARRGTALPGATSPPPGRTATGALASFGDSGPGDVTFPAAAAPTCAPAFSPDWTGEGGVQVTVSQGTTTVHLPSVTTYAVVVLDEP